MLSASLNKVFPSFPTNDGSVKYIVTDSFDCIVQLFLVNKLSCDVSGEYMTSNVTIV